MKITSLFLVTSILSFSSCSDTKIKSTENNDNISSPETSLSPDLSGEFFNIGIATPELDSSCRLLFFSDKNFYNVFYDKTLFNPFNVGFGELQGTVTSIMFSKNNFLKMNFERVSTNYDWITSGMERLITKDVSSSCGLLNYTLNSDTLVFNDGWVVNMDTIQKSKYLVKFSGDTLRLKLLQNNIELNSSREKIRSYLDDRSLEIQNHASKYFDPSCFGNIIEDKLVNSKNEYLFLRLVYR
jgi:hypothetical protein